MREPPDNEWDEEADNDVALIHELCQMADGATALTGDLASLVAWLVSFAPDDAMKQLRFLYRKSRSLATATATIALLDRLLAEPDEARPQLRTFVDEAADDGFLLVELIDWRLAQTREGAAPLFVLRALLARMGARTRPVVPEVEETTIEGADGEPPARPHASLYRLVDQATTQLDELAALISWLLPFAPEDGVREIEDMKAITRSYRQALFAIQSLDLLQSQQWRSPREHVSGDLTMVAMLIDCRIEKERGEQNRLEQIKEEILKVQRLEMQAAARRRVMQEAWGQLAYYEEDVVPTAPEDDDEPTSH